MEPKELREQAKRWRDRAPNYDEETAEALGAAATSLDEIATDQEKANAPAPAKPTEFIHRAYEPKKTPKA